MTNKLREVVADALLPCPVCIGKGSVDRQHDADGMLWVYVSCNKCGLRTRGKWCSSGNDCPLFYREVRDEWNTRATLPTQSAGVEERWVVVRESVLDVGLGNDVRTGGKPELGYALIANAGTFESQDAARLAHRAANLPLGWVVMSLSQLLPDLYLPALRTPASENKEPTK